MTDDASPGVSKPSVLIVGGLGKLTCHATALVRASAAV